MFFPDRYIKIKNINRLITDCFSPFISLWSSHQIKCLHAGVHWQVSLNRTGNEIPTCSCCCCCCWHPHRPDSPHETTCSCRRSRRLLGTHSGRRLNSRCFLLCQTFYPNRYPLGPHSTSSQWKICLYIYISKFFRIYVYIIYISYIYIYMIYMYRYIYIYDIYHIYIWYIHILYIYDMYIIYISYIYIIYTYIKYIYIIYIIYIHIYDIYMIYIWYIHILYIYHIYYIYIYNIYISYIYIWYIYILYLDRLIDLLGRGGERSTWAACSDRHAALSPSLHDRDACLACCRTKGSLSRRRRPVTDSMESAGWTWTRRARLDLSCDRSYLLLDVDDVSCPGGAASEREDENIFKWVKAKWRVLKREHASVCHRRRHRLAASPTEVFCPSVIGVTSSRVAAASHESALLVASTELTAASCPASVSLQESGRVTRKATGSAPFSQKAGPSVISWIIQRNVSSL